jgi:hypothetical protein
MNFKEKRLIYEEFGEWAMKAWDTFSGDVRAGASKVWGPMERAANWTGHNIDNLVVTHLAYDKPDPLDEGNLFEDNYEYYHDLDQRYSVLFRAERFKYKNFTKQLSKCERLKESTENEIKELKTQIAEIPPQIEQHKKSQYRYHSSEHAYKHYKKKIKEAVKKMISLKKDLSAKYQTSFEIVLGEDTNGEQIKGSLLLDRAIKHLELKIDEVEPDMEYYELNMKRSQYWAQRVLDIREENSQRTQEHEQDRKELDSIHEGEMLKQFEALDYDFEGTGKGEGPTDYETISRKVFARCVTSLCRKKGFPVNDLKWAEIFPEGANIDYDGRQDLEWGDFSPSEVGVKYALTGKTDGEQRGDNINTLLVVQTWIESKK